MTVIPMPWPRAITTPMVFWISIRAFLVYAHPSDYSLHHVLFQRVELGRHRCPSLLDLLTELTGLDIHMTGSLHHTGMKS
jgi:hypothetical protein